MPAVRDRVYQRWVLGPGERGGPRGQVPAEVVAILRPKFGLDARGHAHDVLDIERGGERNFFDGRDGAVARARKLLHKLFKGGLKVGKSPDGGVGAPLRGESRDVVAGVHKVP